MTRIDTITGAPPAKPTAASGRSRRESKAQPANSPATRPAATKPASKQTLPISKSAIVIKLLSRAKGATVEELMAETGWQPHSVRAYFSGLRKKGHVLLREQRKGGEHAYRIGGAGNDASVLVTEAAGEPASTDAFANEAA